LFLLLATIAANAADLPDQAPGQRFQIEPNRLPRPYATPSPDNSADLIDRPSKPPFRLPPGFSVKAFASGLIGPRWMAVAPNGDVSRTCPRLGQVLLLRDSNGDGTADVKTIYATGFKRPHGLAVQGGYLYVAATDGLFRLPLGTGDRPGGPTERVTRSGA